MRGAFKGPHATRAFGVATRPGAARPVKLPVQHRAESQPFGCATVQRRSGTLRVAATASASVVSPLSKRTLSQLLLLGGLALVSADASKAAVDLRSNESSGSKIGGRVRAGAMKFYDFPLAFNPPKAKLVLVEKGLPFEEHVVDVFSGANLQPDFLRLNPKATVPTLVDGDKVLPESKQIVEYLDGLGEPLGGTAVDRGFIAEWLQQVDSWDGNLFAAGNADDSLKGILGTVMKHKMKLAEHKIKSNQELRDVYEAKLEAMKGAAADGSSASVIQSNRDELKKLLDKAEARLQTSKFLAGDQYSVADAVFTPILYRLKVVKKESEYLDSRPKTKVYFGELQQRPSFKTVFGTSESLFKTALLVGPSLFKIQLSSLTGRY